MQSADDRFKVVYKQGKMNEFIEVIVDLNTGIEYLFRFHNQGGGLTPLIDQDGKPIVHR